MMNKRGQVFLMTALIITGIMISLVRVSNQGTVRDKPEAFFDLADEIGFETKKVLDYGVIKSVNNVGELASELLEKYVDNIGNEDVAFIYGDSQEVYAYYYDSVEVVAVSTLGNQFIPLRIANGRQIQVRGSSSDATIKINEIDYTFSLKPGQNFYFVLIREDGGEKFVTIE